MIHKSKILIVDDEPLNVKLLAAKLLPEEYEIIRAYNGTEALEKAEIELPDVILLDIMMPDLDGYEVTKRLKDNPRTCDIPIILVTALNGTDDKAMGLASGADEFLNKPVDTYELRARVKSSLSLKQYGEQLQTRIQSEETFSTGREQDKSTEEKTLLLAEDNDLDVEILSAYLKGKPYHIEFFKDGASTIERAKKGDIDLILLDILLSDISGFEVCRQLKETVKTRNIQIVMITSLSDIGSKIRGLELGADDFLVKPINREELIVRVNTLLKKKEYFDRLISDYESALHSAITDKLTGLYNHSYFKQFLELEIERSRRQKHPLTLLFLDGDDFKQYNDTLGHLAGDEILRELGQLIRRDIRKIDLAARYGGEEFAIVLTYTDTKEALMIAERLRQTIDSHPFSYKRSLPAKTFTVSIGVASFQSGIKTTIEDLIERSDKALYRAKNQGKNQVCVFSAESA